MLGSERPDYMSGVTPKKYVMIVTHVIGVTALSAVDKIVNQLMEIGILTEIEEKNPVQLLLHIDVPDEFTFDEVLALGALIGSIETGVLAGR